MASSRPPPLGLDFRILTIIGILTFLFSLKISNYIADFSSIKGKSRIDIFFLVIFFVFLFIPMMHINQAEVSFGENRVLAKWHNFINEDKSINYNFGNDFNAWFNDRFGLRKVLVPLHNTFFLFNPKNGFIDKKTGFLYKDSEISYYDINDIKENFDSLIKLENWSKKHNIKLYILITPPKPIIYPIEGIKTDSKYYDFINYLNTTKTLNVIYVQNELLENKKDNFMFFKTEHHWTDDGAFIGYKALMKKIKKDYPKVRVLNENDFEYFYDEKIRGDFYRDFNYGDTCRILGLSKKKTKYYHNVQYRYYRHKDFNNLKTTIIDERFNEQKTHFYSKGADLKVIQLGTSMNENLSEFLPFTFKNVKRIRINNNKHQNKEWFKIMKNYEKEILDYKPDILIFCITYSNIICLHNIFNKD